MISGEIRDKKRERPKIPENNPERIGVRTPHGYVASLL